MDTTEVKTEVLVSINNILTTNVELKSKWILDSGATGHVTNNLENLYDTTKTDMKIGLGNNSSEECGYMGKVKLTVTNDDGQKVIIVLQNVAYVKDIITNIISLPLAKTKGFKFYDENISYISNGRIKLHYNNKHYTGERYLMCFNAQVINENQCLINIK